MGYIFCSCDTGGRDKKEEILVARVCRCYKNHSCFFFSVTIVTECNFYKRDCHGVQGTEPLTGRNRACVGEVTPVRRAGGQVASVGKFQVNKVTVIRLAGKITPGST